MHFRSYGTNVYVGLISNDGREVAVKRVVTDVSNEVNNQSRLSHPNIVSYKVKIPGRLKHI